MKDDRFLASVHPGLCRSNPPRQGGAEAGELTRPAGGGALTLGAGGLTELTGVLLLRHGNKSGRQDLPPAIGEPPEKSPMFLKARP